VQGSGHGSFRSFQNDERGTWASPQAPADFEAEFPPELMRHQSTRSLELPTARVLAQSEQVPNGDRLAAPIWALEDLSHGKRILQRIAGWGLVRERQAVSQRGI
jgi:hypothetical protein